MIYVTPIVFVYNNNNNIIIIMTLIIIIIIIIIIIMTAQPKVDSNITSRVMIVLRYFKQILNDQMSSIIAIAVN